MSATGSSRAPVLVGVGLVSQREADPARAAEPLGLMVQAARAAGTDTGSAALIHQVGRIYVPRGRWRYRDPGAAIGTAINADASTVLALVGVLQEELIADACDAIAAGEISAALVVGGGCGYRLLQARRRGVEVTEAAQDSVPDRLLRPDVPLGVAAELAVGLGDAAVGYYALIESAFRASHGLALDDRRETLTSRAVRFSEIAAANPHAWTSTPVTAADVAATSSNPTLADPYTRLHTSDWSVDQASALLLCSRAAAEQAGIAPERWIHPRASATSNRALAVSQRPAISATPGADLAARAALEHAQITAADLRYLDLYSSFPVATDLHAAAVGVSPDTATFTGGMRFAGGPFNNYVLHTTGQLALRLRQSPPGSSGLVSSVSGLLTKHAFAVWSRDPAPGGWHSIDVTASVAAAEPGLEVLDHYTGPATVAAATVLRDKHGAATTVCVLDTPDRRRALARSTDPAVAELVAQRETVGLPAQVKGIELTALGALVETHRD